MKLHSSELRRARSRPARARSHFSVLRRRRIAQLEADFLDRLVDAELEFVRRLPVHLRSKPAEALAVLTMLAADHRHYAHGWINRRELRHRLERALTDLNVLRKTMNQTNPKHGQELLD